MNCSLTSSSCCFKSSRWDFSEIKLTSWPGLVSSVVMFVSLCNVLITSELASVKIWFFRLLSKSALFKAGENKTEGQFSSINFHRQPTKSVNPPKLVVQWQAIVDFSPLSTVITIRFIMVWQLKSLFSLRFYREFVPVNNTKCSELSNFTWGRIIKKMLWSTMCVRFHCDPESPLIAQPTWMTKNFSKNHKNFLRGQNFFQTFFSTFGPLGFWLWTPPIQTIFEVILWYWE